MHFRCTCTKCEIMPNALENNCCGERPFVVEKLNEKIKEDDTLKHLKCITEPTGFRHLCLCRDVLQTTIYGLELHYKRRHNAVRSPTQNEYVIYLSFY